MKPELPRNGSRRIYSRKCGESPVNLFVGFTHARSREVGISHWTLIFIHLFSCAYGAPSSSIVDVPPLVITGERESSAPRVRGDVPVQTWTPDLKEGLKEKIGRSSSVWVRSSGTDEVGTFLLRGQPPIQNRYFIEGIPLEDPQYLDADLSHLPLSRLGRADVYPGAIPTELLSDGLGGAINFRLKVSSESEYSLGAGSFGSFNGSARVPFGASSLIADGRMTKQNFLYFDDNGTPHNLADDSVKSRENNRHQRLSLLPSSEFRAFGARIKSFLLFSMGHRQIPGPISLNQEGRLDDRFLLTAFSPRTEFWQATAYARFRWDDLRIQSTGAGPPHEARARGFGLRSRWERSFGNFGVQGTVAGELDQYDAGDFGLSKRVSVPLSASARIGKGTEFVPGLYVERVTSSHEGSVTKTETQWSPRMTGAWKISPALTARSMVGMFFRNPSLYEIYGSPRGIVANDGLKAEKATKVEWGVDYHQKIASVRVGASYTTSFSSARDMILFIPNSQFNQIAMNVGKSLLWWHELAVETESSGIKAEVGYAIASSKNLSDIDYQFGKTLPSLPASRLQLGLSYSRGKFWTQVLAQRHGATYWDFGNFKKLEARWGFDVGLGLGTKWGDFSFKLENLFDRYTAASTYSESDLRIKDNTTGYPGYPAPGRRIQLTWSTYL